jgi:hypothetical protein
MNWAHDNPDRDFAAGATDEDAQSLRDLLNTSDIAEEFDKAARIRVGTLIGAGMLELAKRQP